jgi:hypothetical protein
MIIDFHNRRSKRSHRLVEARMAGFSDIGFLSARFAERMQIAVPTLHNLRSGADGLLSA